MAILTIRNKAGADPNTLKQEGCQPGFLCKRAVIGHNLTFYVNFTHKSDKLSNNKEGCQTCTLPRQNTVREHILHYVYNFMYLHVSQLWSKDRIHMLNCNLFHKGRFGSLDSGNRQASTRLDILLQDTHA